jgi:hypothetical protein
MYLSSLDINTTKSMNPLYCSAIINLHLATNRNTKLLNNKYGHNLILIQPPRGLEAADPKKVVKYCSICTGEQKDYPGFYRTDRIRDENCLTIYSQDHAPSCKPCFKLRRPCMWLPLQTSWRKKANTSSIGFRKRI